MAKLPLPTPDRRTFLAGSAAMIAAPVAAQSPFDGEPAENERDPTEAPVRRNISSFRTVEWQPYFSFDLKL